ncbi:hypothetical protein ACFYZJ_02510 [Streptomyces sp. NPDC001848]|uniref:hypothetical protein n=1 Tax=Streptomyces sp. NPDC001848 TaxID=3364618 RepID=UPI0036BA9525
MVSVASVVVSGWLVHGVEAANGGTREAARRSAIGEYFGGVSVVFSGLALLLLVHARGLLASPVFQGYWARSRARKNDLSPETPEAHVFRLFDQAFADARRGTPPPAS